MITPRLEKIISLVSSKRIADIGTDHAYIPIRLAEQNKIETAVATDKNKGPLEIAAQNVKKYGLENIISLRQGDGLNPLKQNEADEIIIAGMGGKLISDIIEANLEIAKNATLILQPMNAQYELRKNLSSLGFSIIYEDLEKEGCKIYNFMVCRYEKSEARDEFEYHIPKSLTSHKLYKMLYDKKKREFTKIICGMKCSKEYDCKVLKYYEKMLEQLEKTLN